MPHLKDTFEPSSPKYPGAVEEWLSAAANYLVAVPGDEHRTGYDAAPSSVLVQFRAHRNLVNVLVNRIMRKDVIANC